ncbi:MAG TPA: GTPase HflX [Candidatus Sphingobacterium stercoripullorum]|nr:GTPase HflX [Candidatus Sphingobacterium stercoripullorum]
MLNSEMYDTEVQPERAVLVSVITPDITEAIAEEHLQELAFLVETAGGITENIFTQKLDMPNSSTFVGKGKLEEISEYVKVEEIDLVVFDDELSPSQLRNIERALQVRILDRSNLILDIFAKHAKTAQAKAQVELAQLQFMLPRLTRMWTHLERQRGGIGMRGPGEKQLETDRRIILQKISLLKEKLEHISRQSETRRKSRGALVRASLVGYTNVGKSTLMNALSKSDVYIENKLFATLDTTVRKVVIDNLPFLLSDTVGFIRKLPHHLIECFQSTLDEVYESDLLIHVVDISNANFEDHMLTVNQTLQDMKVLDKPIITVFNKVDLYREYQSSEEHEEVMDLEDFERTWMAKHADPAVFISAETGENLDNFRELLYEKVLKIHQSRYPYNDLLY